jgi:diguanylate cyclase (GGDEF)-like protein
MRASMLRVLLALLLAPWLASSAWAQAVAVSRYTGTATTFDAVQHAPAGEWQTADALRLQPEPSFWRLQLDRAPPGGDDAIIALRESFEAPLVAYLPPDYQPQAFATFDPDWRQIGSRHRLSLRLPPALATQPVFIRFDSGRRQPIRAGAAALTDYLAQDAQRVRFTTSVLATLVLLSLVATIFAAALRRWRLLAFAAWIASCVVYVAVMSGEVVAYLPHEAVLRHAMRASLVATNLGVVAIYWFAIGFLDLPQHHPRTARAIGVQVAALTLLSGVLLFAPRQVIALQLVNLLALTLAVQALGAAIARARNGSANGWFFLVGLGSVTLVGIGRVLGFMRSEGTSPLLEWLHPAAYAFGALVLVLATARAARYAEREMHAARLVARIDPLTRLPNRAQLLPGLETLLQQARAQARPVCVLFFDLDHFKSINDRFGHAVGDRCLMTVGHILRRHVRATDLVARYGGEEFVLALDGARPERAAAAAEELRAAVEEEGRSIGGHPVGLTVSIGLAAARPDDSVESLLARADAALYRAKDTGRNRVALDDPAMA